MQAITTKRQVIGLKSIFAIIFAWFQNCIELRTIFGVTSMESSTFVSDITHRKDFYASSN